MRTLEKTGSFVLNSKMSTEKDLHTPLDISPI
jgi:hypothetical protein